MTVAELAEATRRAGGYGLWVVATLAGPVGLAAGYPNTLTGCIAGFLMLVHLACIPVWLGWQRRFLSSTAWAREQGLKPGNLALFSFSFARTA